MTSVLAETDKSETREAVLSLAFVYDTHANWYFKLIQTLWHEGNNVESPWFNVYKKSETNVSFGTFIRNKIPDII